MTYCKGNQKGNKNNDNICFHVLVMKVTRPWEHLSTFNTEELMPTNWGVVKQRNLDPNNTLHQNVVK